MVIGEDRAHVPHPPPRRHEQADRLCPVPGFQSTSSSSPDPLRPVPHRLRQPSPVRGLACGEPTVIGDHDSTWSPATRRGEPPPGTPVRVGVRSTRTPARHGDLVLHRERKILAHSGSPVVHGRDARLEPVLLNVVGQHLAERPISTHPSPETQDRLAHLSAEFAGGLLEISEAGVQLLVTLPCAQLLGSMYPQRKEPE